jgi:hypothetical protein
MAGFIGDRKVGSGLWWNSRTLELRSVPAEGGTLPDTGDDWHRVPAWWWAPLAPLLGAAFLVVLPVAGAALVSASVAERAFAGGRRIAFDLSHLLALPHLTGEAHLTGGAERPADEGADEAKVAEEPDELEEEIAARRADQTKAGE